MTGFVLQGHIYDRNDGRLQSLCVESEGHTLGSGSAQVTQTHRARSEQSDVFSDLFLSSTGREGLLCCV